MERFAFSFVASFAASFLTAVYLINALVGHLGTIYNIEIVPSALWAQTTARDWLNLLSFCLVIGFVSSFSIEVGRWFGQR